RRFAAARPAGRRSAGDRQRQRNAPRPLRRGPARRAGRPGTVRAARSPASAPGQRIDVSSAWRVAAYDDALAAALEEAHVRGVFLIGRLEDRRDWGALAQNGTLERLAGGRVSGLGVHVFTPAGHAGFASSDRVDPAEARQLVRRAAALAAAAATADSEISPVVHDLRAEDHSRWD